MGFQHSTKWAAVMAAMLVCSASCSSTPPPCDDDVAGLDETPAMETIEAFEDASEWLMVESTVVAVGVDPDSWHILGDIVLPTADPGADPGTPGTLKGLQDDLEELFVDSFGFDPGDTDAWVAGGSMRGGTLVLFGDFDEPQGVEDFKIGDLEGFKIEIGTGQFDELDTMDWAYAVPIDEPRQGIVIAADTEELERLERARGTEEPGQNLAVGERSSTYEGLFADLDASTFSVASTLSDVTGFSPDDDQPPPPNAAAFGYSSQALRVVLTGDDERLDDIDERVDEKIDDFREHMEESYEGDEDDDFLDRYFSIYGYHVFESIAGQLEPEFDDDRMRFEVAIDDFRWGSGLMMASIVFGELWDSMTEFDDMAFDDPWAPTPDGRVEVESMTAAAAEYFRGDQLYCDDGDELCLHPWHDGGEPNTAVPDDERVFPGGPDVKLTTMDDIPIDGQRQDVDPQFVDEADIPDVDAGDILEALDFEYDYDGMDEFRITYETGPGVGTEATVKVTAEANFNRDVPGHHRIYQKLEVDADGRLIYHDPVLDEEADADRDAPRVDEEAWDDEFDEEDWQEEFGEETWEEQFEEKDWQEEFDPHLED